MRFEIPGIPIANQRHRHKLMGKHIWTYDPQAKIKQQIKHTLSLMAENQHYQFPSTGPIEISMTFHISPPQSLSGYKHNMLLWNHHHTKKPDLDNYEKFIMDVGNGVLWPDDCQVASIKSLKINSAKPKTVIEVKEITMGLDEETSRVLALFSPDGLHDLLSELIELQSLLTPPIEYHNPLRASTAARILTRLAHLYSGPLTKIKKITQEPQ